MLSLEDLKYFNTGFELGDVFGSGRMKELIFDMKEKICHDKAVIERWQQIAMDEAQLITKLYDQLEKQSYENSLREENKDLSEKLERSLESLKALEEYAASLQKKVEEYEVSDTEVYRLIKSMRNKKPGEWMQEEVS